MKILIAGTEEREVDMKQLASVLQGCFPLYTINSELETKQIFNRELSDEEFNATNNICLLTWIPLDKELFDCSIQYNEWEDTPSPWCYRFRKDADKEWVAQITQILQSICYIQTNLD